MSKASFAIYNSNPLVDSELKPVAETIEFEHDDSRDNHMFWCMCQFHEFGTVFVTKTVGGKIEWTKRCIFKNKKPICKCESIFIPPN